MAESFGTTAPENNPSNLGAFTQNLRFPGQYADQESGLSYNYFRDSDSSTFQIQTQKVSDCVPQRSAVERESDQCKGEVR